MDRDALKEHFKFARDLGVAGVSRDPAWRRRAGESRPEREGVSRPDPEPPAATLYKSSADALAASHASP